MGSRTGENRPANYRDLTDANDAVDLLRDDYQALHARCVRAEKARDKHQRRIMELLGIVGDMATSMELAGLNEAARELRAAVGDNKP